MRVTIESLSSDEPREFGFTPMQGYPVMFSAGTLRAHAWFVPADTDLSHVVGREYEVEVNQERVTALTPVGAGQDGSQGLAALPDFGSFRVHGRIESVLLANEHGGEPAAFVRAGDAYLALGSVELAGLELHAGDTITFVAHDVSLWDEAI
jgi:hypothetical protein